MNVGYLDLHVYALLIFHFNEHQNQCGKSNGNIKVVRKGRLVERSLSSQGRLPCFAKQSCACLKYTISERL